LEVIDIWCFHNYLGLFSSLWDDFRNLWDELTLQAALGQRR
jgi:hypothetical protein